MTDLVLLMSKLVKPNGEILIPGLEQLVAPLTDEEKYVSLPETPVTRNQVSSNGRVLSQTALRRSGL